LPRLTIHCRSDRDPGTLGRLFLSGAPARSHANVIYIIGIDPVTTLVAKKIPELASQGDLDAASREALSMHPPLGNRDAELIDGLHEGARVRRSPKEVLPIPCRDD
jgi:hypothetical protein